MKRFITILVFLCATLSSNAQLNKWLVREGSGVVHLVDFTTPIPTVSLPLPGYGQGAEEDVNVMTDAYNNIMFTVAVDGTNFLTVKDANWNTMQNGTGLID